MNKGIVAGVLLLITMGLYWPHNHAEFVLDDYYTIARNPLIKNPALYKDIWTSRLFDAHQSSGYIRFGYYRPVLESSWIIDYHLFQLRAEGYQWINLIIHVVNCCLVYLLISLLFDEWLAVKTAVLFCVIPSQEWVVRYITGRGDELSALFALIALILLTGVLKDKNKFGYFLILIFWALSALTREVAISYILYSFLIFNSRIRIRDFCIYWILIGLLPLILIGSIISKQGNILVMHVFYFASIGLCLWIAQLRLRAVIVIVLLFAVMSYYQGRFWTSEEKLLRHTKQLENWGNTVVDQQLLMKYDNNIPAITALARKASDPYNKSMWLRRLGMVYFNDHDLFHAQDYFAQALGINSSDADTLNALAVVLLQKNQDREALNLLNRSLGVNPSNPDALRTLGIYYYLHHDASKAQDFLNRCLFFDPSNVQAQELLHLAKKMN